MWTFSCFRSDSEVLPGECLTELPIGRNNVPWGGSAPVTASDPEGQRLTNQNGVWLPVLTPVTAHAHPASLGSFHAHPHDVPCTRDVAYQNQVEVTEAVDCEPDPSALAAWHPAQKVKKYKGMFVISTWWKFTWIADRVLRWASIKCPFPHWSTGLGLLGTVLGMVFDFYVQNWDLREHMI